MSSSLAVAALLVGVVAFLVVIPVYAVPALALASFVALPHWLFSGPWLLRDIGPGPFILLIWALKSAITNRGSGSTAADAGRTSWHRRAAALATVLAGWLVVSRFESAFNPTVWVASFVLAVAVPWIARPDHRARELLVSASLWCGAVLGLLAIAEHSLKHPILYGHWHDARGLPSIQHWSVYRSVMSFEHPLYAGAFLGVVTAFGIGRFVLDGKRLDLLLAAGSAVGLVATVSRGSVLAVAAGILVVVAGSMRARNRATGRRGMALIVIGAVLLLGVANLALFTERASSVEASSSTSARLEVFRLARGLASSAGFFGSGPGTSSRFIHSSTSLVLENSWLQLWVSTGAVGLIVMILFVGALFASAWKTGDLVALGGITAYCVSISTFNAIDDVPSLHILLGFLLIVALNDQRADGVIADDSEPRDVSHLAATT